MPEMRPEALAIPTITPVRTTRLFSEIELLEYQVESMTEGVLEPMVRRKHALWAAPRISEYLEMKRDCCDSQVCHTLV